jgi:hypothetical protein
MTRYKGFEGKARRARGSEAPNVRHTQRGRHVVNVAPLFFFGSGSRAPTQRTFFFLRAFYYTDVLTL